VGGVPPLSDLLFGTDVQTQVRAFVSVRACMHVRA
jgi:hypothetical protein